MWQGENTFFRGLKKLMPGRYLVWQDGKLSIKAVLDSYVPS